MRFKDRVAIVTGAASGIGLATAKLFGAEGARVVVADLSAEKGRRAAEEIKAAGAPDAAAVACDVSKEDQVEAAAKEAVGRFGRLDVVVNNAGLMLFKPIEGQTGEDWLRILSVDLLGAFYFTKQAFLVMKGGGAVVNVSSVHAVETEPLVAPYAAAKAALLSLTRSAALEGKPKGVRVNAVLPGAVDTPMLWDNPNVKSGAEQINPADVGKPEQVAEAIAFHAYQPPSPEKNALKFADGASVPVHVFAELLKPMSASVLATWERDSLQGVPAVTENKHGRGKAVYYGSFFNLDAARYLLSRYAREQNLSPLLAGMPKEVEVTRRSKGANHYYFILNHRNEAVTVNVGGGFYDLLDAKESPASITLAPFGYRVLRKGR